MSPITVGILTVSDSCYLKEKEDKSGKKLEETLSKSNSKYDIAFKEIVPDDVYLIEQELNSWVAKKCNLILTTGGTGFGPRDVTPEATKAVIQREAPGLAYAMISNSLTITKMAVLSRAVCGIKDQSIIINLPGSPKAAVECFGYIESSLSHAVALVTDDKSVVAEDHKQIQKENLENAGPSKVKLNVAERARTSNYPMVEVEEATLLIIKACGPEKIPETVSIEEALHRTLAEDVFCHEKIPPFDASIKDGYAVRAADGEGSRTVKNFVSAGDNPDKVRLESGEAIRICTGAPIPLGADAVVQVEDTILVSTSDDGYEETEILINKRPKPGQDIRLAGSDIAANTLMFNKGDRISAAHIGVLATIGKTKIEVFQRPSVGIISTGNELVDYHEELKYGSIRDSNRLTLMNLLKRYHFNSTDYGIAKDDPNILKSVITKALTQSDVVITTGGVSMGEFDLIKQILIKDFQATIFFGRVNMKPGKPTTFASMMFEGKKKLFFGLPGNPASACVTCLLFVVPALKYLEGNKESFTFPIIDVYAFDDMENTDVRPEYVRATVVCLRGKFVAYPTGQQISSKLNSLIYCNGLLYIPGETKIKKDSCCQASLIDDLYFFSLALPELREKCPFARLRLP